jgi:HPt (histidine-containing phosphotransfer) domain-containing protein
MATVPLIDFDFLYNLAGNDTVYVFEVIKLYLDTMPAGLERLEQAVRNSDDFDVIHKQAHFLKSSASIVKVRNMHEDLIGIEMLARQQTGKDEMIKRLDDLLVNYREALPLILAERDKCKPKKTKAAKK